MTDDTHFSSLRLGANFGHSLDGYPGFDVEALLRYFVENPVALDADGLVVAAGGTGGTPLTLVTGTLDFARQVTVASVGNDSGITFLVDGTDILGRHQQEVLTGANAGTATTAKTFKTITAITPSGDTAANVTVGWNNVFGLPAVLSNTADVVLSKVGATTEAFTVVVGDTTDPATSTTDDPRGTFTPTTAPDAANDYLIAYMPNTAKNEGEKGWIGASYPVDY